VATIKKTTMKLLGYIMLLGICLMSFALYGQTTKKYVDAGFKLEKSKDYSGAIDQYTEAIALNAENKHHLEAHYFRANCYRAKGNYSLARTDYDAAVKLTNTVPNQNPRFLSDLHYNRAMLRIQGYNTEGAIEDLDIVIKNSPADALSYAYRGRCKYVIDDKVGACADFAEAKRLKPSVITEKFQKAYKKTSKKCK
jgi:tetratricopeptide (TPR) repeat protein